MSDEQILSVSGIPQHIVQLGINRQSCFYKAQDYQIYLDILERLALRFECRVHAYVLMRDHVHLLLTPMTEDGATTLMQEVNCQYAKYIKTAYTRSDAIWKNSFQCHIIDSDIYLLTCMCFIELNPVRSGVVSRPAEYKWSSYKSNALNSEAGFIERHPIFSMLGDTGDERQYVYRGLFQRYIENDFIHQIRDELIQGFVPSRSDFRDKLEKLLKLKIRSGGSDKDSIKEIRAGYYALPRMIETIAF